MATLLCVGGAMAAVATLFLPWARSGRADRSGFELARTVDALGLASSLPLRALLIGLWLAPLMAGACWTLAALGRRRWAAMASGLVGALLVSAAVLVLRSDAVRARPGPWLAIVASTAAFGGALRLLTHPGG